MRTSPLKKCASAHVFEIMTHRQSSDGTPRIEVLVRPKRSQLNVDDEAADNTRDLRDVELEDLLDIGELMTDDH